MIPTPCRVQPNCQLRLQALTRDPKPPMGFNAGYVLKLKLNLHLKNLSLPVSVRGVWNMSTMNANNSGLVKLWKLKLKNNIRRQFRKESSAKCASKELNLKPMGSGPATIAASLSNLQKRKPLFWLSWLYCFLFPWQEWVTPYTPWFGEMPRLSKPKKTWGFKQSYQSVEEF